MNLHDERPWVARRALLQIANATDSQAVKLTSSLSSQVTNQAAELSFRLDSLWALCANGSEPALASLAQVVASENVSLAQAACHAISLHRYKSALPQLERAVAKAAIPVRRAAAEALGRIGSVKSVEALMYGIDIDGTDRALEHSVTYALIEIGDADAIAPFATSQHSARQQQAAMIALDQLGAGDRLSVEFMLAALDASDAGCSSTAADLLSRHAEWAPRFAAKIAARLQQSRDASEIPNSLMTIARGWKDTESIQELIGASLKSAVSVSPTAQRHLVRLLSLYEGTKLPSAWDSSIAHWLTMTDGELRQQLVHTLSQIQLGESNQLKDALLQQAMKTPNNVERLQYLAALPSGTKLDEPELERSLLESLQSTDPEIAQAATFALKRIKLSHESGDVLLKNLKDRSPRDLYVSVEAINRLSIDALDESMLNTLADLPSAKTLSMDQLLNLYRKRGEKLRALTEQVIAKLSRTDSDIEAKVDAILAKLGPGDPIRGLQLFRSSKAACSSCHRLGYVGGEIGPELTRIGSSRTRRALLEAILFPSARLEQSYQPVRVLTLDGQVYNGIVRNSSNAKTLDLQLTADKTISIPKSEIELQEPSQVSIMPAGMQELLTIDELADLLALLESGK